MVNVLSENDGEEFEIIVKNYIIEKTGKTNRYFISILSLLAAVSCNKPISLEQISTEYAEMSDGTKIAYKEYGKGKATLVFVHGFGCDMNAWSEQFKYFEDKAQMVFIDVSGHGQSDKPQTEYTLGHYAESVKSVLDKVHVQNAVLIGHSLGSAIARQTIFNYPQLASKLVDVDGVYCFYPEDSLLRAENAKQYDAFVSMFKGEDITQTFVDFIQPLFIRQTPEKVKDYAMSTMPKTPSYVAYSTMKNLVKEENWTGAKIGIPSLVIASKNSQIPPDYESMMARLYPAMQYCELDSIGHFIMMEQPEMFNKMLEDFIK